MHCGELIQPLALTGPNAETRGSQKQAEMICFLPRRIFVFLIIILSHSSTRMPLMVIIVPTMSN